MAGLMHCCTTLMAAIGSSTNFLTLPAEATRQPISSPKQVYSAQLPLKLEETTAARREQMDIAMRRRNLVGSSSLLFLGIQQLGNRNASSGGLPEEEPKRLCDATCEKQLENVPMVSTESGLQYKDITVGTGPSPPVGYQVAANYVAMIPSGKVFDSSLEKGQPYIFRVGAGQVIKGLDEGLLGMKVGGKRRLYIPGPLAFPKGLTAAAGRPRVPPNSPVVFDVSLEYIPGLDDELE